MRIRKINSVKAEQILEALRENNWYCPCALEKNMDTKCPCKEFMEQQHSGECKCGLYEKMEDEKMIDVILTNKTDDDIVPTVGEELVDVEVVNLHKDLPLPMYQTLGASGMDLYAAVNEEVIIPCGGRTIIPTGIQVSIPRGYEMQIRPRSGLAAKYGVTVCNAPGTIDAKGMM